MRSKPEPVWTLGKDDDISQRPPRPFPDFRPPLEPFPLSEA